jgi:hypothetical protein
MRYALCSCRHDDKFVIYCLTVSTSGLKSLTTNEGEF